MKEIYINGDLGDIKIVIAERADRSLRYEEARRGDILSIKKERARERDNWVLEVRKIFRRRRRWIHRIHGKGWQATER